MVGNVIVATVSLVVGLVVAFVRGGPVPQVLCPLLVVIGVVGVLVIALVPTETPAELRLDQSGIQVAMDDVRYGYSWSEVTRIVVPAGSASRTGHAVGHHSYLRVEPPCVGVKLDRFTFKLSIGYPDRAAQLEILDGNGSAAALDALLATVQVPPGVPVATVGIDNAKNAAHLAIRILKG